MAKKKAKFIAAKEIRKLARERVGKVPPVKVIPLKPERREKHRQLPTTFDSEPY